MINWSFSADIHIHNMSFYCEHSRSLTAQLLRLWHVSSQNLKIDYSFDDCSDWSDLSSYILQIIRFSRGWTWSEVKIRRIHRDSTFMGWIHPLFLNVSLRTADYDFNEIHSNDISSAGHIFLTTNSEVFSILENSCCDKFPSLSCDSKPTTSCSALKTIHPKST